jgi:DNA ligase 1
MEYRELVDAYHQLEQTTKRLEKAGIIAKFLKHCPIDELDKVICLLQGKVFPEWDERKIGFGSQLMLKAISTATGASANDVEKKLSRVGDLGKVGEEMLKHKKQATLSSRSLTVKMVIGNIRKLAELEGEGTVNKKINLVIELLNNAKGDEARFIIGTILEELRIGIAEGIVRDAIAEAFNKEIKDIESAHNILVDYGEVAMLAKEDRLGDVSLKPGKPFKAMLAILVRNVKEGFESVQKPAQLEFKLDGFRIELHNDGRHIKLFTRRMEDVTRQFPDIVEYAKKHVKAKTYIIDAEAVGYNPKTKKYMPFQSISQRIKRKYDIEETARKFPVEVNVFDVLYCNGKSVADKSQLERRAILEKIIRPEKWRLIATKKLVTDDEKTAEEFFKESLEAGHEGLMIKSVNASYKPGRYVDGWVKLKQVMENLDLCVVEAIYGEGKRATWLTSYVIACRHNDGLLEIGKVSTGVKEKAEGLTYKDMTNLLKPLATSQKGRNVTVRPKIVIEVAYEEIQKSPTYSSGMALRFPRVIRLRQDKPVSEIATLNDIKKLYETQRGRSK